MVDDIYLIGLAAIGIIGLALVAVVLIVSLAKRFFSLDLRFKDFGLSLKAGMDRRYSDHSKKE